jgi:lipoic acid synthetase
MTVSTKSRRSARLPGWLQRRIPLLGECGPIESIVRGNNLHTVCREALCPNRAECYSRHKATFLVLGDVCTRGCRFCSVLRGTPAPPDAGEPARIAKAAEEMGLETAIVTSVTRDDLPDGGAGVFADTVRALKRLESPPVVEVLIPDFGGNVESLATVLEAGPDILAHNVETVRRLYGTVRRGADYERSLFILSEAKRIHEEVMTKSSLILGLGETTAEVREAFRDLRRSSVDFLTVGQYLRPGMGQVPVRRYVSPERFARFREEALGLGFHDVAAGPLVRSSYQEVRPDIRERLRRREGQMMRGGTV